MGYFWVGSTTYSILCQGANFVYITKRILGAGGSALGVDYYIWDSFFSCLALECGIWIGEKRKKDLQYCMILVSKLGVYDTVLVQYSGTSNRGQSVSGYQRTPVEHPKIGSV